MQRKQIPELLQKYLKNNYKPVEKVGVRQFVSSSRIDINLDEEKNYALQRFSDNWLDVDDFSEIENEPFEIFIKKRYRSYGSSGGSGGGGGKFTKRVVRKTAAKKSSGGGGGKFAKRSATKKVVIKKVAAKKTVAKKSSGGGNSQSLNEYLKVVDESFIEIILKIIDKRKLADVDVYKKANIDRKLFSKLRNGNHPSKTTAVALCIALKLSYDETINLLKRAGYALSDSIMFDVIISFFIKGNEYRIDVINEALLMHDQKTLGPV